jgi:tripartite-type tricarboxylate transporter receptor subunit TctC
MKLSRHQFLHLAAGAAALPTMSRIAWAQAHPTRSVRMIVPFPAGGSSDILARLMGQCLAQPFLVESRPGASGNIGTEAVCVRQAKSATACASRTPEPVFGIIKPVMGCILAYCHCHILPLNPAIGRISG